MSNSREKILVICLLSCIAGKGQENTNLADSIPSIPLFTMNPRVYKSGDTTWIYSGICKPLLKRVYTRQLITENLPPGTKPTPLFTIHGNIQYDFTHRSLTDTPFYQQNFSQHSVQSTLDISIKERYPVKIIFYSRRSNSPYFEDITDVNIQFSQSIFFNSLKNDLRKQLEGLVNKNPLRQLEERYNQKVSQLNQLKGWLSSPGRLQESIENKEAEVRAMAERLKDNYEIPRVPGIPDEAELKKMLVEKLTHKLRDMEDSLRLKADSLNSVYQKKIGKPSLPVKAMTLIERKKEQLDSLQSEIKNIEKKLNVVKKSLNDSIARIKQEIAGLKDKASLQDFVKRHKIEKGRLPKGWQTLSAINTIGIGRTWVDYSELTVKNISLTGINIEVSPSRFYVAFAAGKINYRFRDFIIKDNDRLKQKLLLARAGIGSKDGNHLIFTWYDGKRNLLNSFGATSIPTRPERVVGMSAELRLQLDPNNYIIAESAKSSFQTTASVSQPGSGLIDKVWNFKDRGNEAFSIKLYSFLPQSSTKLNGYYRKTGERFQSFNLQPFNATQEAYHFKIQQSFWKKRLTTEAGLRKNDFSNPYINPGIASKTVFKSLQVTLRIPKYPFVSLGYFPSSQLTVLDNNIIAENQYNTLSAVITHAYRVNKVSMSTNAVYLKFYNSSSDTGFIYYNASSWTIHQFIFLKALQLQSGLTLTEQRNLSVVTWEQSAHYQLKEWLLAGGGIKYNRVNSQGVLWGGTASLGLMLKKIGMIQASCERSYLPGTGRNLLPVDMGRVTYTRVF